MTIKKLCRHLVPTMLVKIRNTHGDIDEITAGDVEKQSKAFQNMLVHDWTVYENRPDNECSRTFAMVDID